MLTPPPHHNFGSSQFTNEELKLDMEMVFSQEVVKFAIYQ